MKNLFNFFSQEVAIDLGTANTLVISGEEVVVDEPSIVAIERNTNKVIAVGKKAMMMHEKTHQMIKTVRPLKDGVIADFEAAESMIQGMIDMLPNKRKMFRNMCMVVCIPSELSRWRNVLFLIRLNMLVLETYLIHEPMAAALVSVWMYLNRSVI